jgi:transcriptional antiterminator
MEGEEEEAGVYAFVGEKEEATEEEEAENLLQTNKQTSNRFTISLLLLLLLQKNCNCKISQLSGYREYDCTSPYPTSFLGNPTIPLSGR